MLFLHNFLIFPYHWCGNKKKCSYIFLSFFFFFFFCTNGEEISKVSVKISFPFFYLISSHCHYHRTLSSLFSSKSSFSFLHFPHCASLWNTQTLKLLQLLNLPYFFFFLHLLSYVDLKIHGSTSSSVYFPYFFPWTHTGRILHFNWNSAKLTGMDGMG